VYLNTQDVEIAKKIAKAIRFSSGGLRYVKGMGVLVRGLAQVSMNLTDFEQTPIARVFEFVKREAARYGVIPVSSEIVGLIPKKALEEAAEWFLQVENFDSSLILENRLAAVTGGKAAVGGIRAGVEPFIEQLAAPTATPGGGSASAAAGAMAAALATMVATMSGGKKAYQQYERELSDAIARLTRLREELKTSVDLDAASYAEVMKAYKDAKTSAADLGERMISDALKNATRVPLGIAQKANEVRQLVESLKPITSKNMWSDLAVASSLARTAIEGGLANVQINLQELKDEAFKSEMNAAASALAPTSKS
jgi:glutamate formiminotransferase/formiminotetrahydrofolate cyclodeaminase